MALNVKYDQGDLAERENKLRKIKNALSYALRDQQSLNFTTYNYREHLDNLGSARLGTKVQSKMYEKIGQLINIFPKGDNDIIEFGDPLEKKKRWSKEEIIATENNLKAFYNPHGVIEAVITGDRPVSHDEMNVVRSVHPELFKKVRMDINAGVASGELKLNRQQQLRLGMFLDIPTDSSQTGPYMSVTNALFAAEANLSQNRGQAAQASMGLNLQTNLQRREQRGL